MMQVCVPPGMQPGQQFQMMTPGGPLVVTATAPGGAMMIVNVPTGGPGQQQQMMQPQPMQPQPMQPQPMQPQPMQPQPGMQGTTRAAVTPVPAMGISAADLLELAKLKTNGILSENQFEAARAKVLEQVGAHRRELRVTATAAPQQQRAVAPITLFLRLCCRRVPLHLHRRRPLRTPRAQRR